MTTGGYVTKMTYRGELKSYEFRVEYDNEGRIVATGAKGLRVEAPDFQFLVARIRQSVDEYENSS